MSEGLVTFGPADTIKSHIAKLQETWPQQHAVAIVESVEEPRCGDPAGDSGETTYCWVDVKLTGLLHARWLNDSPRAPGNEFTIHYWYPDEKPFNVKQSSELLVFLAPTHGQGIYSSTALLFATPDAVAATRSALQ